jgi:hypothetical protein
MTITNHFGVFIMPQSFTKECNISYQVSQESAQIDWLINHYGDRLEKLGAVDKTAVWSALAFWQTQDTEFQSTLDEDEQGFEHYTLDDAIRDCPELPNEAEEILNRLVGISDETCFDLMVALSHQIRAGIFAEETD